MKLLANIPANSLDSRNGLDLLRKWLSRQGPEVELVNHRDEAVDGVIYFDFEQFKAAFGNHKFKDARKQVWNDCFVTYDTAYWAMNSQTPELKLAIASDVLWAIRVLREGLQDPMQGKYLETAFLQGFDLETEGFEYWNPDAGFLAAALDNGIRSCVEVNSQGYQFQKTYVEDQNTTLAGHNIKFDLNWWQTKVGPVKAKVWSTDVAAYLLDDNAPDNSLGFLTTRNLLWPWHKDEVDYDNLADEPQEKINQLVAKDARGSLLLVEQQRQQLEQQGLIPIMNFLMDLIPVFSKMERRGVLLDQGQAMRVGRQVLKDMETAKKEFGYEVNMNSPKQLIDVLYKQLKLPVLGKTKAGQPGTDKDALKLLLYRNLNREQEHTVRSLLKYRENETLWKNFFKKFPDYIKHDGRVHTTYGIAKGEWGGTVTGRTSSRNPNLQNIPHRGDIRGCFRASWGYHWLDADYTGLELCCVADLSEDENMMRVLREGLNIHTSTMSDIFKVDYQKLQDILDNRTGDYQLWKNRRVAIKTINFGIIYGISANALSRRCKVEAGINVSPEECQEWIDQWKNHTYPGVGRWLRATEAEAREKLEVTAVTGQKRRLPGADGWGYIGGRKLRQACNFPVQHMASTILLTAMYLLDKGFEEHDMEAHLLMNVHDQVACEFKGDPDLFALWVRDTMENVVPIEFERRFGHKIKVPLRVDLHTGSRWS